VVRKSQILQKAPLSTARCGYSVEPSCRTGNVLGLENSRLFTTVRSFASRRGCLVYAIQMFRHRFGRRIERVLARYADDAWLRSVQKETKFPKSFLELLGIVRLANSKVRRHCCRALDIGESIINSLIHHRSLIQ
jgi:hypothetical protein